VLCRNGIDAKRLADQVGCWQRNKNNHESFVIDVCSFLQPYKRDNFAKYLSDEYLFGKTHSILSLKGSCTHRFVNHFSPVLIASAACCDKSSKFPSGNTE